MLMPYASGFDWDPFAELRQLQRGINRRMPDYAPQPERRSEAPQFPPVNVWTGDNSVVVTAELPGVDQNDLTVSVLDDGLTIAGKREPEFSGDKVTWHRRERAYGRFSRTIRLPYRVDRDKVDARFVDGVLEIELQRPEADRPKKIAISKA